ncbi:TonB-dependent receptor [Curvibacter sp. HBC28]|uniref:TonB-dependent receptor n=1 Tax=Curvibacter microcysteis TaxID=3026419 RepID=A0ABT5ME43_9BURK|nr:TonB-dependent receptor [Curvibacter sp. HBC28]MDD0814854.1 TonB-dependent receptor [Curvibacter sp. HBC28]
MKSSFVSSPRATRRLPARPLALSALIVLGWAQAAGVHAQQGGLAASADSTLTLGTVQITDRAQGALPSRNVLSSVDVLGGPELQDQSVDFSWELLQKAPGVLVTPFRQGTDAGRFSFRGFNGEGRVNAVKLLIDGIPSNDNAGGMPFLDAVFPLDIERIEVVRGTNDPRYGLHNIAGNAQVFTRQGGHETQINTTVGSFGTREVQVAKGIESGGWTQNYLVASRESDGYRDHANARKLALAGKWFYTTEDGAQRVGLSLRHYENDALESGYLSAAAAASAPRSSPSYASADRSTRHTNQLGLYFDTELGQQLSWSTRAYRNEYSNQRWVRFTQAGVQQERDSEEAQTGAISTLTWRPTVTWAKELVLEGGVDFQRQTNVSQRYRTVERVRTSQFRDWDFSLNNTGAYVQAVVRPTEALKIVPALRVDQFSGQFRDRLAGTTLPLNAYGTISQPKLSVVYAPWRNASVYANLGRSFQIGTGIDSYRGLTQARDLQASLNDGWELGLKFSPAPGLDGRVAYWEQKASGEVARTLGVDGLPDPGGLGNIGRTRRRGVDLQAQWRPDRRASAWVNYSHQEARITAPDPSAPTTQGKEVENVPHYLASLGADYQLNSDWKLSAWGTAQGSYFVERSNTLGKFGGNVLLNLSARWQIQRGLNLQLQVRNLANRRYEYVWYDSGSWGHAPGDGRAFYATLGWTF